MTIVAAGNNTWLRSEIDPAIVGQADLVVVDDIDNAKVEAGELMRAAEAGTRSAGTARSRCTTSSVASGRAGPRPTRSSSCELQGIGIEDVAVAELAYRRACERGIGLELPA